MHPLTPPSIQPLLEAYLGALDRLHSHFYGIYVYGSVALGAFDQRESDIDILALTEGQWTPRELKQLRALHNGLVHDYKLGKRRAVLYVPSHDLGKIIAEIEPYPYAADGKFHPSGHSDLNAVTWWLVKHKGIALLGPEPAALPLAVAWADVMEAMRYNLNRYWASKAQRSIVFLLDDWIVFGVTTLCRILSTIEDGVITTKPRALVVWRERLPARFRPLLDEAVRIRTHASQPPIYRSPFKRRAAMLAFVEYAIKRGNAAL